MAAFYKEVIALQILKRSRQSAGVTGNGWDGSLYSEVIVLPKAKEEIVRYEVLVQSLNTAAQPSVVADAPQAPRR